MARRRWIADEWDGAEAALVGSHARHLARVLRAQVGAQYEVAAGSRVWLARVTAVSEERVAFALEQDIAADAALPLTVLLAVWKFDRMEWAIEKLTELGAERVAPVLARRTEKHLAQAAPARAERWRRIAAEAARQSRRVAPPTLDAPLPLREALSKAWLGSCVVLDENERGVMLSDVLPEAEAVTLAVGPEGGWAPEEALLFAERGWVGASLGPRILRAETAAIAGAAIAAAALLG